MSCASGKNLNLQILNLLPISSAAFVFKSVFLSKYLVS